MAISVNPILKILICTCLCLCSFFESAANNKEFTVVIDPGHGGKDIGAADNGVKEKDINLKVALALKELLSKKRKDINVVMTRHDDTYLTLQERADKANKAKGDLFISIHTNSVDKKNKKRTTIEGSSVYALGLHKDDNNMQVARRENSVIELESDYKQKYSGFDPSKDESYIIFEMAQKKNLSKSIKFAEDVEKELVASGRADRGVHQAGFWVLWATSMPAVLVELDFICNPSSAKYISSEKGAKELSEAIFNAIDKYSENWGKEYALQPVVAANKQLEKEEVVKARKRRSEKSKTESESQSYELEYIPVSAETSKKTNVDSKIENLDSEIKVVPEKNKKNSKKKNNTTKKKDNKNNHKAKVEKLETVYKIQILVSTDLLKQNNPRFQGLSPITTYKDKDFYKYYVGETTDKQEIDKLLKDVKKKIPDAFIVSTTRTVNSKDK